MFNKKINPNTQKNFDLLPDKVRLEEDDFE